MCANDFGDQGVSPQQTKFAANPGRVAACLLFVVGSLGEEDGLRYFNSYVRVAHVVAL